MSKIDCFTIITGLSNKGFNDAKAYLTDYLSFYYVNPTHADADLITEKVAQCLAQFEAKNLLKDDDLACVYAEELINLINNCAEPGSRANRYLDRAKQIRNVLKTSQKEDISNELDDITSIFLCFINEFNKDRTRKIEDFTFDVLNVNFNAVMDNIDKDNPNGFKIPDLIKDNVPIAKGAEKNINQLKVGLNGAQKQVGGVMDIFNQKKEKQPIHDTFDEMNHKNYSRHNFMKLMLILMYFRVIDQNSAD